MHSSAWNPAFFGRMGSNLQDPPPGKKNAKRPLAGPSVTMLLRLSKWLMLHGLSCFQFPPCALALEEGNWLQLEQAFRGSTCML